MSMFNNLKIRYKLVISFSIMISLMVIIGLIGYLNVFQNSIALFFSIIGAGIAIEIALLLFISQKITEPLSIAIQGLKVISTGEGDLTIRLPIKGNDEIGELSVCFNNFMDKLTEIIGDVSENSRIMSGASSELLNLSTHLSDNSNEVSEKSQTVAAAAVEMSANMDSVASSMGEASNNVDSVASSVEEMSSTVNEIAQNSERARLVTSDAVSRTEETSQNSITHHPEYSATTF